MVVISNFSLEVVTPDGKVVDGLVNYVSVPGFDGEFGVLEGHTEFLTTLKPGEIKYEDEFGEHFIAVSWGYVEVKGNSVIILADNAELAENIDVERAEQDRGNWEKEIFKLKSDDAKFPVYVAKLERAKARIAVANRLKYR